MARSAESDRPSCGKCGAEGAVVRPTRLWWAVIALAWTVFILFGACFAVMLPLNLVLVPAWLMVASAVGPLARRATEPRCRACGASCPRYAAPEVPRGATRPADERAMEGALIGEADA